MKKNITLIDVHKLCIPELYTHTLIKDLPEHTEIVNLVDWLNKRLSEQQLIDYIEWKEYNGYIPNIKPLTSLSVPHDADEYIFTLIENINWSTASIAPYLLPYVQPLFEHINSCLQPHGVRLVHLKPFENAYILYMRDDDALMEQLH